MEAETVVGRLVAVDTVAEVVILLVLGVLAMVLVFVMRMSVVLVGVSRVALI